MGDFVWAWGRPQWRTRLALEPDRILLLHDMVADFLNLGGPLELLELEVGQMRVYAQARVQAKQEQK